MLIRQGFKFQLKTNHRQAEKLRQFAGCARFVWNKALALEIETYKMTGKRNGYNELASLIVDWKRDEQTAFLKDAQSQILQQSLKDLDQAYANFFDGRASFPNFKKRGRHDSFRYPQGFKIDEGNSRVYLPKIGWVKYFKDRNIIGTPKNVTVSQSCGHWHVSIQTEREVEDPVHPSSSSIGIDMGIVHFATLSNGTFIKPVNAFKKYSKKLAKLQRKLGRKVKFSANWKKIKFKIQKLHKKIADTRRDFLHKATTAISKNHAMVVVEDLQVANMSKSAAGILEKPGRNVRAKSGLNKSILDQGWAEFVRMLEYKTLWNGGKLVKVNPQRTSQKCSKCGFIFRDNRKSQSEFKCEMCGFEINADINAALNILAAGHAVSACGEERVQASSMKQESSRKAA